MQTTMQDTPMGVQLIMHHGRSQYPDARVLTYDGENVEAMSFADVAAGAERLAHALSSLGIKFGDRVGTFCWNHAEHMQAYLAVPCMGAILHTLNLRLFPEQIEFIINHADDRAIIVDASLVPLLEPVLPNCPGLAHLIVIGAEELPEVPMAVHHYEHLLSETQAQYPWPEIPEINAAAVCYTSGTTGNPKGVVYSHKSTFVHSLVARAVDTLAVNERDRILLLPPMFHANAWGLPYAAFMSGAELIMPREFLQAPHIAKLIQEHKATFTAAVPTLVNDLLNTHDKTPLDLSSLRTLVSGGSAVPTSMIERVREAWGVPILQGWGMTETSPLCALSHPMPDTPLEEEAGYRAKAGRPVPGVQVRIVDGEGQRLPHDGETVGELQLRGPWITGSYHDNPSPDSFTEDGWLRTGDVGHIDDKGFCVLTDRTKDVIKSGGEWISSVELEGVILGHPKVLESAVIGVPDERWQERPLALVITDDDSLDADVLREYLSDKVARWWIPEYWAFVQEIPKTSVGKIDKKRLRAAWNDGELKSSMSGTAQRA